LADREVLSQGRQRYAVLTIEEPFRAPFTLIPNAYKTLMRYMEVNGLRHREAKDVISCFERVYEKDGKTYMDVSIACE